MRKAGEGNALGYVVRGPRYSRKYEHVVVAEAALRKTLPKGAQVHHVNMNPNDNRPENLVICPDDEYHKLLHKRQRALDACGNPNWRKCVRCHEYDDTVKMAHHGRLEWVHPMCAYRYNRAHLVKKKLNVGI